MQALREQMRAYYEPLQGEHIQDNRVLGRLCEAVTQRMEAFAAAHPEAPGVTLKAHLQETIAELFEPAIFTRSPFFYEMGVRPAESWGVPSSPLAPACWLYYRQEERLLNAMPEHILLVKKFGLHGETPIKLWAAWGFDRDHHCLGYSQLLREGVGGLLRRLEERVNQGVLDDRQAAFLDAAQRGCRTVIKVAHRFADKAEELLRGQVDEQERRFLGMIARAARWTPENPPRSFYEALAMIWFLREAVASLEAIGVSVVGRLDRLLIDYYRADREAGRLTEAEARDLLARWMLPTDVKFHVEQNRWPETSTCMELGGCDESGAAVFNELTRLILDVHYEQGYLNPKLNCRYSAASPPEYLELLCSYTLKGHNQFAFLNDDVLIPACVKAGKTIEEARLYVNGGCQETMVEGVEHSAGAFFYFNIARAFNMVFGRAITLGEADEELRRHFPRRIENPADFEQFYAQYLAGVEHLMVLGTGWSRKAGSNWDEVQPCPLFSCTLKGCIENARDYSVGAAKYNPSGLAVVGFATVVDALLAVKTVVYEQGLCTLDEVADALEANWQGHEPLRRRMMQCRRYGHGDAEADALAGRLSADLAEIIRRQPNERGDVFQPSYFVYYAFVWHGAATTATPDGRYDGDMLAQGIAPSRLRPPQSLTQVLNSVSKVDFTDYAGNAVLDLQLPAVGKLTPTTLAAVLRTFAQWGGPTLQCNFVSVKDMQDAQVHPDKHQDMVVRISGLSARFVCLDKAVQDEIIGRMMLAV